MLHWVDLKKAIFLKLLCLASSKTKIKSTKEQTLGELCMRGTANGLDGLLAFNRGLPLVACGESDTG